MILGSFGKVFKKIIFPNNRIAVTLKADDFLIAAAEEPDTGDAQIIKAIATSVSHMKRKGIKFILPLP